MKDSFMTPGFADIEAQPGVKKIIIFGVSYFPSTSTTPPTPSLPFFPIPNLVAYTARGLFYCA